MLTYKDIEREYGCTIRSSSLKGFVFDGDVMVGFKFPDGFEYNHTITNAEIMKYDPKIIEDYVCQMAVKHYKQKNIENTMNNAAKALSSLNESFRKAINPFVEFTKTFEANYVLVKNKQLEPEKQELDPEPEPKLRVSETYTIGFDLTGGEDTSVAMICKVDGVKFKVVGAFTGEEAEKLYDKITNIRFGDE